MEILGLTPLLCYLRASTAQVELWWWYEQSDGERDAGLPGPAHWEYFIDSKLIVFTSSGQVQSLRGSINLCLAFLARCEQARRFLGHALFPDARSTPPLGMT